MSDVNHYQSVEPLFGDSGTIKHSGIIVDYASMGASIKAIILLNDGEVSNTLQAINIEKLEIVE